MIGTQRYSFLSQLAILLLFCGGGLLLGSALTYLLTTVMFQIPVADLENMLLKPENTNLFRVLQLISSFCFLGLPAMAFSWFIKRSAFSGLGFSSVISGKQVFIVVAIVFFSLFISSSLGGLNQMIPFSKESADYFQSLEDNYSKQMLALANMKSLADYLISLAVLGLMPAVFEEVFFRGCVQPVMIGLSRNVAAGIFITAFFFSAIHFSVYGFLPRLFLGIILGYIYHYSKNLWLSVTAHFLNNAFALTQLYGLSRRGDLTPEAFNDNIPVYWGFLAAGILYFVFRQFKQESELVRSLHNFKDYTKND